MMLWRCAVLCLLVACGSKHVTTGEVKRAEPPTAKQPTAPKPVAVAFVFEGWQMWVGDDQVEDIPEEEHQLGVLKNFKEEFEKVGLKDLPAGSKATVVSYTDHASVRRPMGPIETLTAAAFGEQKDYVGVIDRNLVAGVTLGLDELAKVPEARRVLVVIGDGTDENPDAERVALAALAKRAAVDQVQIVSIVYKSYFSPVGMQLDALEPDVITVNTVDGIAEQLSFTFDPMTLPPVAAPPGGPPFTLAILMNDQEVWVGNDDITPPGDPSRYTGALHAIRAAFDREPMTGFPAGSQAMVITYDNTTKTLAPRMPIEKLDARTIGTQKDYYNKIGTDLVAGVRRALAELAKTQGGRRVLVILGDGNDSNNETAKVQLRQIAKRAAALHVEVHALVWKGALSVEGAVITELDPKAKTATTADELTSELMLLFGVFRNR